MKRKIMTYLFGALLITSSIAYADSSEMQKMHAIEKQTRELQEEVDRLQNELAQLEHKRKTSKTIVVYREPRPKNLSFQNPTYFRPPHPQMCPTYFRPVHPQPRMSPTYFCPPHPQPVMRNGCCNNSCGNGSKDPNKVYDEEFERAINQPCSRNSYFYYTMGSTVTTSPFLGLRSAFDASDLIVNLPTMNEDLKLLKEHVEIDKQLCRLGVRLPDRPIIELSGKIEGLVFAQEDFRDRPSRSDIDISSVRLDILAEVSRGVHGFMSFNMDNSRFDLLNNSNLDIQLVGSASRVFNSSVFISRAFVTIGDLNCFPFYFTIGQMFVPFGRYASNMITSPLTLALARTNERALLLGVYERGFYGSVYGFRGESNINSPGINQWGTNWGYEYRNSDYSVNLGVGYIGNIADSTTMQVTGAAIGFFGFALNAGTEILAHRVPAGDAHVEFSLGHFGWISEYIWTTREFDVNNLSFNGDGAQPSALNLEASYTFKICERPASFAIGYGRSWEALALAIPEESFLAAFNISLWKNTIESFEIRHDNNYPSTDFAGGNGAIPPVLNSVGGSRNTYTMQIGVYF